MIRYDELTQAIEAEEARLQVAKQAMHDYLAPILTASGKKWRGQITSTMVAERGPDGYLHISTVYRESSFSDSDTIALPMHIIEAADPIAAAKQWAGDCDTRARRRQQERDRAELDRLQRKLAGAEGPQ